MVTQISQRFLVVLNTSVDFFLDTVVLDQDSKRLNGICVLFGDAFNGKLRVVFCSIIIFQAEVYLCQLRIVIRFSIRCNVVGLLMVEAFVDHCQHFQFCNALIQSSQFFSVLKLLAQ